MALEVVKESSDVFVPLKSVVGGLSVLLKQYDQFIANKDDVQRLIGRVELLTISLTGPPRENDIKEIARREVLERDLGGHIFPPTVTSSWALVVSVVCRSKSE
jgi:hypothetical protein